ncbi:cytochrome-c peroxidase [Burkholderia multivorans]|uniref:cytochrome-c peroxidase n=1 Tax=Burkholderia multivorans TaxID=87883 RepID=UPI00075BDF87|nr:cytochrome c peroxidase [Burkholderia multivorans]KWF68326.1 cytochrome-c peroxidase [Burkholderia multivorans]KWF74885.1 cytochrome-c peroxidase [Burkholderia multivorans]MBU9548551.1 c-type cytochrome [Burkholderia multivorans]
MGWAAAGRSGWRTLGVALALAIGFGAMRVAPGAAAPSAALSADADGAADAREMAALGKLMFFDPSLSASGRMSCATCHSPAHAYGPPNGFAAQFGGADLKRQGTRAVPSLRYVLNRTPAWSHAQAASMAERLTETDNAPIGGFGWDGRFNRLRDQASFPLLNPDEMANPSAEAVVAKLRRAPYADRFRRVFGAHAFDDPTQAFANATRAIERFELDDPSFHPYTSKFDYYLDGKVALSAQELRGKRLFDDPARGNCASCHIDQPGVNGAHPLLTDFTFEALGVPRNRELRANANPAYYDLGLCGPLRTDQTADRTNCGLFKTPSLRNAASRRVFFHNGRFHTLKDALRFYVQRDTDPAKWYPADRRGRVVQYDDLPPQLRVNVDRTDEPLTRKRGERPVWSERDIDDVAAFLATLDDGYVLPVHTASRRPSP